MIETARRLAEVSLTLIPPSPVTDRIEIEIRGAVWNRTPQRAPFEVTFYLDTMDPAAVIHREEVTAPAGEAQGVTYRRATAAWRGRHKILMNVTGGGRTGCVEQPVEVLATGARSTKRVDGAWAGIYHWSEQEGRLWNEEIKRLTDVQWREQVRAMHAIGMDIIVLQESFRNQMYAGKHKIAEEGYHGNAFYPSRLFPGRMPIAAQDPLEAILSEADAHGMHVFLGIGLYAWFDFTRGSLEWHRQVARELWERYGHHASFYGWYVGEEAPGSLDNWAKDEGERKARQQEIVEFFRDFRVHCRRLAPDKPVMLATNCHGVPVGLGTYSQLLKHLDILCPFGFHRMPEGDIPGEDAATILQKLCDEAGAHLWMDMEAFLFDPANALYPRPIECLIDDLVRFPNFEKILCYQYPGLFNAPWSSLKPGGEATVKLYVDYQRYLESL